MEVHESTSVKGVNECEQQSRAHEGQRECMNADASMNVYESQLEYTRVDENMKEYESQESMKVNRSI